MTLVNSYGRAAATIRSGLLYFNNVKDHRVYRQSLPSRNAIPITPAREPHRFAFFIRHPTNTNIIFTVKEDHTIPSPSGIITTLAYIDARSATVHTLASGADFYINPTVNGPGTKLAWLEWNHPHMQWKGSQLYVADILFHNDGSVQLANRTLIAGDPGQNAVYQFAWCPPNYDSDMVLAWDKTDFCEPWIYSPRGHGTQRIQAVFGQPNSLESDFADPTWWLDDSSFVFIDNADSTLWATVKEGVSVLNFLPLRSGDLQPIPSPYVEISRVRRIDNDTIVFIGTTPIQSASLIRMTLDRQWTSPAPTYEVLFAPPEATVDKSYIPSPKSFKIPKRNGLFTYAHFYPPTNPLYAPLDDEKPPCLVSLHSGPTLRTQVGFQWLRTFFTSRGFAWLDIDYCGSTGYGKEYRNRLEGNYGVADVEDVIAATEYLSLINIFDGHRVALRTIAGGSFPALQVLTTHSQFFIAAATHFMVADLASAARDITDKPTRYYLSTLMGGTPEEVPEVYRARNPVIHADRITLPLLVTHYRNAATFEQAQRIVETISRMGGEIDYLFFDPSLPRSAMFAQIFERELRFFQHVFGCNNATG
ncbi:alpha/beta-hydrolase [Pholiota conissans]|uniref:Alpha/beta-hydrolase n=1 Tax=Pholiota conissans TaxID=109636 RepID=A0A9P5Z910_9AGAR|nr:alpha/beta-hydrolase [Pholiota conissans]